jgi:hypothetical protein
LEELNMNLTCSSALALVLLATTPLLGADDTRKDGESLKVTIAYERVYDASLNVLKRLDQTIESASKETGQIVTAMVWGGGNFLGIQTGKQVKITVFKDSDTESTIRVVATTTKRHKTVYDPAQYDAKETARIAAEIRSALKPPDEAK